MLRVTTTKVDRFGEIKLNRSSTESLKCFGRASCEKGLV